MANPKYDIYFRGEILPEADEAQVKAAIAKIFKADDAKLAQLFSGKVNTIKKSVDKATAGKYQQAFKKAGAKAVITLAKSVESVTSPSSQASAGATPAPIQTPTAAKSSAISAQSSTEQGSWDILPTGSDLLKPDERRNVPDADIDTSEIKMVSPFAEVEVEEKVEPPAPDTSHISVAEVGEDMNPDRAEPVPELKLDLSEFSVAEAGATLADKKEKKIPAAPDTNHIKLV